MGENDGEEEGFFFEWAGREGEDDAEREEWRREEAAGGGPERGRSSELASS